MRTSVDLPEPILRDARLLAATSKKTLSSVVEDALRQHLAMSANPRLPAFRLRTVSGGLKDASLDLDRTSALDVRDDEGEYGRTGISD
jgi:hypothetical protein